MPRPTSRPSSAPELGRGLADRIRRAAQIAGSGDALSQKAGIPRSTLETYLTGEAEPKASRLAAIARAAGVSPDWLLTGEGSEFPDTEHRPGVRTTTREREDSYSGIRGVAEPGARYVYLPLYDLRAAAGTGSVVDDGEHQVDVLAFKEDWIRRELRATPADLRLIYVEGDSMEPDLRAGDIVLVDHTDTVGRREGIYVIRMDGSLLVKQLQRLPGGVVKLTSRNSAYEPFTVPAERLEEHNGVAVIGRVVWACRRF